MSLPPELARVSRVNTCPICGKPDWCLIARDGSIAICPRVEEGSEGWVGEMGYKHVLDDTLTTRIVEVAKREPPPPTIDAEAIMTTAREAAGRLNYITTLSHSLGVTAHSLHRLGVGYLNGAAAFPMKDFRGKVVGIRLRIDTGGKWAVTGSRSGLFYHIDDWGHNTGLIAEGPTDAAALMDLGYAVVGRPSCRGSVFDTIALVQRKFATAVIVSDHDGPGYDGARALAKEMRQQDIPTKIIRPLRGKDARQWVRDGATRDLVGDLISSARFIQ